MSPAPTARFDLPFTGNEGATGEEAQEMDASINLGYQDNPQNPTSAPLSTNMTGRDAEREMPLPVTSTVNSVDFPVPTQSPTPVDEAADDMFGSHEKAIASKNWRIRDDEDESQLDDHRPPSVGPVSLGSYAKFKPLPRRQSRGWSAESESPSHASPSKRSPRANRNRSPEKSGVDGEIKTPRAKDKAKGHVFNSSPLRKEVVLGNVMSPELAKQVRIGAQFDIQEWDSSLHREYEDPTVLESVPLTPEMLRARPISTERGQSSHQMRMRAPPGLGKGTNVILNPPVAQKENKAFNGNVEFPSASAVGTPSATGQPGGDVTQGNELEARPKRTENRGSLNMNFQFPGSLPLLSRQTGGQYQFRAEIEERLASQGPAGLELFRTPAREAGDAVERSLAPETPTGLGAFQTPPGQARGVLERPFVYQAPPGLESFQTPPNHDDGGTGRRVVPQAPPGFNLFQTPLNQAGISLLHGHGTTGPTAPQAPIGSEMQRLRRGLVGGLYPAGFRVEGNSIQQAPVGSGLATGQELYRYDREKLLRSLHGVAASGTARANSARTVMHDPVQQPSQALEPSFQELLMRHQGPPDPKLSDPEYVRWHPLNGPTEPLPWRNRPAEIITIYTPPMTTEQLRAHTQQWLDRAKAEFRQARGGREAYEAWAKASEAITEAWWRHDGRGQEDIKEYLEEANNQRVDEAISEGRPVGYSPQLSESLLIPVLGNLNAYMTESPYMGRGMDHSLKTPPDWCIDRSATGIRSFFGEDCGAPPQRVGRDPRYRMDPQVMTPTMPTSMPPIMPPIMPPTMPQGMARAQGRCNNGNASPFDMASAQSTPKGQGRPGNNNRSPFDTRAVWSLAPGHGRPIRCTVSPFETPRPQGYHKNNDIASIDIAGSPSLSQPQGRPNGDGLSSYDVAAAQSAPRLHARPNNQNGSPFGTVDAQGMGHAQERSDITHAAPFEMAHNHDKPRARERANTALYSFDQAGSQRAHGLPAPPSTAATPYDVQGTPLYQAQPTRFPNETRPHLEKIETLGPQRQDQGEVRAHNNATDYPLSAQQVNEFLNRYRDAPRGWYQGDEGMRRR